MSARRTGYQLNHTAQLLFEIHYRVKGEGPKRLVLDASKPGVFDLARAIDAAQNKRAALELELDPQSSNTLRELGLLIRQEDSPPNRTINIDLADLWKRPRTKREYEEVEEKLDGNLVLNPNVWSEGTRHAQCPMEWYRNAKELMNIARNTVYVQDPRTLFTHPLNLTGALREEWRQLKARKGNGVRHLKPDVRRCFAAARLLIPERALSIDYSESLAEELRKEESVVIRNLIGPIFSESLREYVWSSLEGGWLHWRDKEDAIVERRWSKKGDPVMHGVHLAVTPFLNAIATVHFSRVRPSWSFLGVYAKKGILRKHRDRPQCRWNLSLCLGSRPHLTRKQQWPLNVKYGNRKARKIKLGVSDALIYAGHKAWHSRPRLTRAEHCAVWFAMFVESDFVGDIE